MKLSNLWIGLLLSLCVSPVVMAQDNLSAVDSLKKEVAKAVFVGLKSTSSDGIKAEQIRQSLDDCGMNCDPAAEIRRVGGWNAVAEKLAFFDALKKDPVYVNAGPEMALKLLYNSLSDFYEQRKNEIIYKKALDKEARREILSKVNRLLPGQPSSLSANAPQSGAVNPEETISDSTDSTDEGVEATAPPSGTGAKIPWLYIAAGVLGGFLVGALGAYFIVRSQAKGMIFQLEEEVRNLKRRPVETQVPLPKPVNAQNEVVTLPKNVQNQLDLLDKIRKELDTLDPLGAIKELKEAAAAGTTAVPQGATVEAPVAAATLAATPQRPEVFFYPAPNEQGFFDDAQRSTAPTPDSAYKLIVSPQRPELALFRFETEPGRMRRFLTYRTYFIDPACESENNFQDDVHSRIITYKDGKAIRENGSWKVQTKAVIRFE